MGKKEKDNWKLEHKHITTVYEFDTVRDSPYLCTITVTDGTVTSYEGVFALDSEITRKLEADGVIVPLECRA